MNEQSNNNNLQQQQSNNSNTNNYVINELQNIESNNEKQVQKSKNIKIVIISVVCIVIVCGIIFLLALNINKEKHIKKLDNSDEKIIHKGTKLAKEEIEKIEEEYKKSENVLNISDIYEISDRGSTIVGIVQKGRIGKNNIVSFINSYGEKEEAFVTGIEMFRKSLDYAESGDNAGVLLRGVSKEDIENSSIIFKNKEYNGYEVTLYIKSSDDEKVKELLENTNEFEIVSNKQKYNVKLNNYYLDYGTSSSMCLIYFLVENDELFNKDQKVNIPLLNMEGTVSDIFK